MGHLATAMQSCLTRINDMGGPADPADSTGWVLLLTFTEATIMVSHEQCKHSSRDAQKGCSWTRTIIKRINLNVCLNFCGSLIIKLRANLEKSDPAEVSSTLTGSANL